MSNKKEKEKAQKTKPKKNSKLDTKKLDLKVSKTVQDTIPYFNVYKNGIIEVREGFFTKSYPIKDINFQICAQEEQEDIFIKFGDLLNSFDANTHLQLTINNKNIDIETFKSKVFLKHRQDAVYLENGDTEKMKEISASLNELRDEYNTMLEEKMCEGRNNIEKEKYITIGIEAENIDIAVNNFSRIDGEVSSKLKRIIKDETYPFTLKERLQVLYNVFNIGNESFFNQKIKTDNSESQAIDFDWLGSMGLTTKDIIGPDSFEFEKDYFKIGDTFAKVMFLDTIPTFLSTDFLADISNTPINMMTSIHYNSLRQDKALKMIKNQMVNINSNVIDRQKRASRSGYDPSMISPELLRSQEESNKLLGDMTSRNQKLYTVTFVVMLFAETKEELDKSSEMVTSVANKHLCSVKKLSFQQEFGLATALPLCYNRIFTNRLLTTESASVFIPFETRELSQEKGMYYGLNAISKNMILFNRINSKNQNGVILGTPGSGKSFSAKREIVNVFLNTQDEVYIIDPDREYAPLSKLLGGETIRIAAGASYYINPMDMDIEYADDDDPVTLKTSFLISFCETAVGGKFGLNAIQKSIIDRCVGKLYRPYVAYLEANKIKKDIENAPTLEDLYNLLLNQPEAEAQELAVSLEMYCVGSLNLFAHKTNVNLHSRFVVFDIKDIGSSLKELGVRVCLDYIWNKMISNRRLDKRTWFYIDEFYLLIQNETSSKFLMEIWKRARKWGGVPTGITQNVEDMLASKEGRSIISNCDFVMMLNQAPIDRAELAQMFNISATQIEYVTNSDCGQGLIYDGKTIIPFIDKFPTDTKLFKVMNTKPDDDAA